MNKKHKSFINNIVVITTALLLLICLLTPTCTDSFDKVCGADSDAADSETPDGASDENSSEDSTEYKVTTEHPDEPDVPPDIVADAAIVMDADTGNILYQKNAFVKEYPASITKIMTCLLALENCSMDETVTMSYDAIWGIERDSNHISLDVGEEISMKDCLYALMLESANEVAWGIGEHISNGDISAFSNLMTEKAAELGCLNTNFTNANGLPDENHYTTCYDMALITQAALQYEDFRTITNTLTYTIGSTNLCEEERTLWQHCKLTHIDHRYTYEYCEGGKTGYTTQALNTLVSWSKKDGREIICVIMNCQGASNAYTDTIALSNYCFDNFKDITPPDIGTFCEEHKTEILDKIHELSGKNANGEISFYIDDSYKLAYNSSWSADDIDFAIDYYDDVSFIDDNTCAAGMIQFLHDGEVMGQTALFISGSFVNESNPDESVSSHSASPADADTGDDNAGKKGMSTGKIIFITVIAVCVILATLFGAYIVHIRKVRMQNKKRREMEIHGKRQEER